MLKRATTLLMAVILLGTAVVGPKLDASAADESGKKNVFLREQSVWESVQQVSTEVDSIQNQTKIEALAMEIFPEYMGSEQRLAQRAALRESATEENMAKEDAFEDVVYSETRPVSDTEELTYITTASGVSGLLYKKTWNKTSTSAVSGGTRYTRSMTIVVLGCVGSVHVQNMVYDIYSSKADKFVKAGTVTGGITTTGYISRATESGGNPATAQYSGGVTDTLLNTYVPVSFSVEVGSNSVKVKTFDGSTI